MTRGFEFSNVWPSAFVAFAFSLHPLHVESVAWIAERKDVLCAFFFILTLWAYVFYTERPAWWRYALVILAFACALLSKSMAVTLPFVLLLLDYWPLGRFAGSRKTGPKPSMDAAARRRANLRIFAEKLPLFLLSLAASVATFLAQRAGGAVIGDVLPLGTRIANALVTSIVYLLKFFWPSNLAVFYPYSPVAAWQAVAAAIVIVTITAGVIIARRTRPYLAVGWFWYLGMLVPVIGIVQVGLQARADRYTYLPMVGVAIMLALGTAEMAARRSAFAPVLAGIGAIFCVAWLVLTSSNLQSWRNGVALAQHAIESTTDNYIAYNNLGTALRQQGNSTPPFRISPKRCAFVRDSPTR